MVSQATLPLLQRLVFEWEHQVRSLGHLMLAVALVA